MDEGNVTDVPLGPLLIRFGSWNVGSMRGKSSEVVEVLEMCAGDTMEGWKHKGKSAQYKFLWPCISQPGI